MKYRNLKTAYIAIGVFFIPIVLTRFAFVLLQSEPPPILLSISQVVFHFLVLLLIIMWTKLDKACENREITVE